MVPGDRADPVRAEELRLVEHPREHASQLGLGHQRRQPPARQPPRRAGRGCSRAGPGAVRGTRASAARTRDTSRSPPGRSASPRRSAAGPRASAPRGGRWCRPGGAARRRRSRPPRPTSRRARRAIIDVGDPQEVLDELEARGRRTPAGRARARARSRACSGRTGPSRRCRRPARACRRWAAARCGRTTPMLSRPRKPPSNRLLPSASLRFTHQVKLSSSLWKTRSRKSRSPSPRAASLEPVGEDRGPGVDRRVHVAEVPLVGGQLAVGVQVPLAQHQLQLAPWRSPGRRGRAAARGTPGPRRRTTGTPTCRAWR